MSSMQDDIMAGIQDGNLSALPGAVGGITAANWQPTEINIQVNGKPAVRITAEQALGKFEITDEMILELGRRNQRLQLAIFGLMNMEAGTTVEVFRTTINALINESVNELHRYLAEKIAPTWVVALQKQEAEKKA